MIASCVQITGLVAVVAGAVLLAGLAGALVGGGAACVYVGLALDRGGR